MENSHTPRKKITALLLTAIDVFLAYTSFFLSEQDIPAIFYLRAPVLTLLTGLLTAVILVLIFRIRNKKLHLLDAYIWQSVFWIALGIIELLNKLF